jgi:hypothetical protein
LNKNKAVTLKQLCEGFAQAYHKIPNEKGSKIDKTSCSYGPGAKTPIVNTRFEVAAIDAWLHKNHLDKLSNFCHL